jgi:ribonucleoside-diphosphate reductase beta chain
MSLTKTRDYYKPFQYDWAFDYCQKQNQAHWLPTEVAMSGDIQDWNQNLTESERQVLGQILKSFTQTETYVNDYWSKRVSKWFPVVEICMMSSAFSNMECVHMWGYSYLNDSLGLDDYKAFLQDDSAMAKLDRLKYVKTKDKKDIARSLAIFSGFTEGVNLFSSFAILLNLSRFNMMKGVSQIVSWSIRDESLHSEAGCRLFREFISENPEIWTDDLKKEIYEAARITVELEDNFIDKAFSLGEIRGLDPKDLKNFIRHRTNTKLQDLNLKVNWKNIDKESLAKMEWFEYISSGVEFQDFFAQKVTEYSKGHIDWDKMYDKEEGMADV